MKVILLLFVFIFSFFLPKEVFAYENGDFQYWNNEGVEVEIGKHWKISVDEDLRFGGNAGELYYLHTDGGVTCKVFDWLSLGLNYRLIEEKKNKVWKLENRPHCNATLKWTWREFIVSDRNLVEYRIREDYDDAVRYINKAMFAFFPLVKEFDLRPYVANEVFADFSVGGITEDRIYTGVTAKVFKRIKLDLYYLWQTKKEKRDWASYNILGTKVKLVF